MMNIDYKYDLKYDDLGSKLLTMEVTELDDAGIGMFKSTMAVFFMLTKIKPHYAFNAGKLVMTIKSCPQEIAERLMNFLDMTDSDRTKVNEKT